MSSIPTQSEVAAFADHMTATGTPADQVAAFRAQFEAKPAPTEPGSTGEGEAAPPLDARALQMLEADVRAPDNLSAYTLPYEPGSEIDPAAREADTTIRSWLADAQMPAAIGSAIAQESDQYLKRVASFSDTQHEQEAHTTMAMLERVWGQRTNEMLDLARGLVAELDAKHGGRITEMLESTGLGNCPGLVMQLAQHAERRQALTKAKGGKR